MNRILSFAAAAFIIFSSAAFAVETNFDGKLGGAFAPYPAMPGLDITADYQWVLDPFFSAGCETGLFWVQWDKQRGKDVAGQSMYDIKSTTNAYAIPVLATAQIRLPNLKDRLMVLPYLTVGMGFTFMPLTYSDPAYVDKTGAYHTSQNQFYFHSGFTWKVALGAAFTPSGSNLAFLGETGYIGSHVKSGSHDIDMSRFFLDLGVRFSFGK